MPETLSLIRLYYHPSLCYTDTKSPLCSEPTALSDSNGKAMSGKSYAVAACHTPRQARYALTAVCPSVRAKHHNVCGQTS